MKKFITFVLTAAMLAGCSAPASSAPAAGKYTAGTYSATEQGFGGDVTVTITTDAASITNVEIVGDGETPTVGGAALETLVEQIKTAQSAEIDGVSGATVTSTAVKNAAAKAIAQAEGSEMAAAELNMTDGTYTAKATSYDEENGLYCPGELTMTVEVKDNKVASVTVDPYTDTDIIGGMAFPILAERVVETQSLAIDMVSGATVSSGAFMAALKDCLTQAGGADAVEAMAAVEVAKEAAETVEIETEVLVIGAGMAGLSAALSAAQEGAKVTLVEKNLVYSSSTTRSVGYIIGGGTDVQAEHGIEDTAEKFAEDLVSLYSGEAELDVELLRSMAANSKETLEWVEHDGGVHFDDVIRKSAKGERATPRIHTTPSGGYVTSCMVNAAVNAGVEMLMGTPAVSLIQAEDGSITGAKCTNGKGDDITITSNATIVCAGSYTDNMELFHELNPRIDNIGYACGSGVGDAYNWFKEVGADIVNVPYTQFMYYAYGSTFTAMPEVIPNSPDTPEYSVLLVAGNSERVTAEDNFCFEFTKENWNLGYSEGYCIVDQEFMDTYPVFCEQVMNSVVPNTDKQFGYSGETAADLAAAVGLDADKLTATVDRYNELCEKGTDDDFDKDPQYLNKLEGTLYIVRLPMITTDGYTGARINMDAQVVDTTGTPIKGLYAAGSCADGHVTSVNYYGCGTSLLTCATFGRRAGAHAAHLAD